MSDMETKILEAIDSFWKEVEEHSVYFKGPEAQNAAEAQWIAAALERAAT